MTSRTKTGRRTVSAPAGLRDRTLEEHQQAQAEEGILRSPHFIRWQVYLREWEVWKQYSRRQSNIIERAWHAEAAEVDLGPDDDDDEPWTLNFVALTQTNKYSGTSRPIQRVLVTHN